MAKIDLTFLRSFTKGDPEKIRKYIGMFLESAPQQLSLMEQYYAERNWPSLKVAAHSLKPQMNYMGITDLEHTIKDIEFMAGTETNVDSLPEKISYCRSGCELAFEQLRNELNKF